MQINEPTSIKKLSATAPKYLEQQFIEFPLARLRSRQLIKDQTCMNKTELVWQYSIFKPNMKLEKTK